MQGKLILMLSAGFNNVDPREQSYGMTNIATELLTEAVTCDGTGSD